MKQLTKNITKSKISPNLKLVITHGKKLVTTSLIVSEQFNKRHDNIIRKIDIGFKSENKEILDFTRHNFKVSEYIDQSGKANKMYEMTEEGFAELAMSFTGEKSKLIRIRFLAEFKRLYVLSNDEVRKEALQNKRDTARPMTDMLQFLRDTAGKETKGIPHCTNEHKFCNRALNGKYEPIEENDLDAYDARLLGKIREHNTLLMTRYLKQADRRRLLDDFVSDYRVKNPRQYLIEEPRVSYNANLIRTVQ